MMKMILKVVQSIRKLYWWIARPTTRGVRAIVVNNEEKVLLVKHRYLEGWFIPGGKADGNEQDEAALLRELWEELGIQEVKSIKKLGEYQNNYEYKKDNIAVFVVKSFTQSPKKHFEIEEYSFFDPQHLPNRVSPGTRRRIEEWLGKKPIDLQW